MTPAEESESSAAAVAPETAERASERRSTRSPVTLDRIDDWCEKGILGLVLAMLVYGVLALAAARMSELLVITGLETIALVLWVARLWIRSQYRFLWAPISWAVIA